MCKTWNIKYACEHVFSFRLSTCRGTFTTQAKRVASCRSGPILILKCSTPCGPCQRAEIERGFEERIAALELSEGVAWVPSAELLQVKDDYVQQHYHLLKRFPAARFVQLTRPEKGQRAMRASGSLLKSEVQPEDILSVWTPSSGWDDWDSTDCTYKTMQEELAEREAEKDPAIREYEAMAADQLLLWQADTADEADVTQEPDDDGDVTQEPNNNGDVDRGPDDGGDATEETLSAVHWVCEPKDQHVPWRRGHTDRPERWLCLRSWIAVTM